MRYRLVCAASALVLTGCFSDPPSSPGGSGDGSSSSTSSASSTSAAESGSSTVAGTTSPGETTDDDTTSVADASSSSGGTCELFPFEPGAVPADIVVLIDDSTPVDQLGMVIEALDAVGPNNLALLAPQAALAELDFDSDCPQGCGTVGCADNPSRVIVPYNGNGYDALAGIEDFSCIFREPFTTSTHLFFITSTPEEMPPENLGDLVLEGDVRLRVHLACPGCDIELNSANNLLAQVIWASGGSVSNTMMPGQVVGQAGLISSPRLPCVWEGFPPDFYLFEPIGPDFGEEVDLFAGPGFDAADCDIEDLKRGAGVFLVSEENLIFLCPGTCDAVQKFPVDALEVSECL